MEAVETSVSIVVDAADARGQRTEDDRWVVTD